MANLTITVDEAVLKRARIKALEQGTSVNAVLSRYLEVYAQGMAAQQRALESLEAIVKEDEQQGGAERASRRGGRTWRRDDLYDR